MGFVTPDIKTAYASMSAVQKADFLKTLGIKNIDDINSVNLYAAQEYLKSHNIQGALENNSAWTKYNKAKAAWNNYHDLYTKANAQYHDLKDIKNSALIKYTTLKNQAIQNNGGKDLSAGQDAQLRRQSNYTTETITNAYQAEFDADMLLDKCYQAVDAQRAGLIFGMQGEFKLKG